MNTYNVYLFQLFAAIVCINLKANHTLIECETPLLLNVEFTNKPLGISILLPGGYNLTNHDFTFTFKPDPVIEDITPLNGFLAYVCFALLLLTIILYKSFNLYLNWHTLIS